jgi:hypothetical protein
MNDIRKIAVFGEDVYMLPMAEIMRDYFNKEAQPNSGKTFHLPEPIFLRRFLRENRDGDPYFL